MISMMAKDFFVNSPVLALPLVGLGIFVLGFVVVVWQVARTSKEDIDALAALPLTNNPPEERASGNTAPRNMASRNTARLDASPRNERNAS